jgi:diguanylate cyclase (GGDEF)-like protein
VNHADDAPGLPDSQQISGVLTLIRELTGRAMHAQSMSETFVDAFRSLHGCIEFDLGAAVMLEQNLDLYVVTRQGAEALVSDRMFAALRDTLAAVIPASFASEPVVIAESAVLPPREARGDQLRHAAFALVKLDDRTAGLLLLQRDEPLFSDAEQEVLEIFSAQVSLLLTHFAAREQILALADTDDLTGIWNKRYFRRQLPHEIERSRVYGLPLSLLMFDIDDFKEINDTFGHTAGDVVLSELCGAVRETLRPPDLFARFGGDEFAIILPHTDLAGAMAVADRIMRKVTNLTIPTDEEGAIQPAISMGVADFRPGETAAELTRRADERLYLSKRNGKNRYTAE